MSEIRHKQKTTTTITSRHHRAKNKKKKKDFVLRCGEFYIRIVYTSVRTHGIVYEYIWRISVRINLVEGESESLLSYTLPYIPYIIMIYGRYIGKL